MWVIKTVWSWNPFDLLIAFPTNNTLFIWVISVTFFAWVISVTLSDLEVAQKKGFQHYHFRDFSWRWSAYARESYLANGVHSIDLHHEEPAHWDERFALKNFQDLETFQWKVSSVSVHRVGPAVPQRKANSEGRTNRSASAKEKPIKLSVLGTLTNQRKAFVIESFESLRAVSS